LAHVPRDPDRSHPPKRARPPSLDLTEQIELIHEALTAIQADPMAAANPKYAFLFSAAFMHSNPTLLAAAGFGPNDDFAEPVGISNSFNEPRAPQKANAYAKAMKS